MKSAETVKRQKERADLEKKRAMKKKDVLPSPPRLTQEELLEEAKMTEEVNLKSLGETLSQGTKRHRGPAVHGPPLLSYAGSVWLNNGTMYSQSPSYNLHEL